MYVYERTEKGDNRMRKRIKMETIEELEDIGYSEINDYSKGYFNALKDVLGLIDIRLKQNERALRAKSIGRAQYNWTKNELEELKKRITG